MDSVYDSKSLISIVAIVLIFIGYIPYVRDIFLRKTKPHIFSWFLWTLVTFVIYALQRDAGAGAGAWVTLTLALLLGAICMLALKYGTRDIHPSDVALLICALLALPLWIIVHQPVLSIILLCCIDMCAFIPTVRKSWHDPYSETLSLYVITTARHALSIFALAEYNIITMLFPLTWICANGLFAALLYIRRKSLTIS